VELWQDGQRRQVAAVSHGLRRLTLTGRGLRVNGRPLTLRGLEVATAATLARRASEGGEGPALARRASVPDAWEDQLRAWRERAINLLVAPVTEEAAPLWALADRLGFLVLGRVTLGPEASRELAGRLAKHVSCFGWLVREGTLGWSPPGGLTGLEREEPGISTEGTYFLVCPGAKATEFARAGLPLLVRGEAPAGLTPAPFGRIEAGPE
jgi:hypothetical protein